MNDGLQVFSDPRGQALVPVCLLDRNQRPVQPMGFVH